MSRSASNSDVEDGREAIGPDDPMASIRPELPASPPLVAATVELTGVGPRDRPQTDPHASTVDPPEETHESGPFTIPVHEPDDAAPLGVAAPYELLERVGVGGMGEVWEARQRALGRVVALKRLRKDRQSAHSIVRQFESEARLTGVLDHPNIVTVHELGRDQAARVFYTMKRIQGTAWSEVMASNRRRAGDGSIVELELRDHLEILLEVSQAIAFAHSRGVIHRDIKPGNVMIGDYGEVQVVDWGLAVALRPLATLGGAETWTLAELPRSALVCGTPAYMSPETAKAMRERIGPATDVYLLGAVLFHVLYGRPPHKGKSVQEVITKAKANAWSFPSKGPSRKHEAWDALLRPVINRALATDPDLRFADARAFGEALREALRNYDSAKLATRAQQQLAAMDLRGISADSGYRKLSGIIARLEGALESWPRNLVARRALGQAHLELAALALANDDLKLAKISIDAYAKLPPLPEPEPERISRRVTLHPADGTLIGAPRPTESLVEAGTASGSPLASSPVANGEELARTLGARELGRQPRPSARPNHADAASDAGRSLGASASVDVQHTTNDALLDDEALLAARAERLREGLREHEHEARKRRRALRLAAGLVGGLIVVVITLVATFMVTLRAARDQARDERNQLSRVLLDETASTTEAQLEILFQPVHGALMSSVMWARAGALELDEPAALNAYFMPLLEGIHAATSMLRADAAGYEYMLLRQEQGWLTRTTTPGSAPTRREWTDEGALLRTWTEARDVGYHPHVRPWYEGGVGLRERARQARRHGAPHPVYWTKPYKFFTTEELGISVSTPATGAGGREFVIAFDLKLGDLSTHTRELPVGIDQGQVFVLDDEDRVLGLPKETRALEPEQREALLLEPITELLKAPISRTAALEWQRRDRTTEAFLLELGPHQRYWVGFRRVDAPDRPKMWIGVVVPESHFLADGN